MKGRLEDRRLLTGQGRFISDWNLPNQAYAVFLRSDRAHAEIVSVDASAALEAPGVLAVLTGRDVAEAGYKPMPTTLGVVDRFGEPLKNPPRPVLAQGKVRHVGECVACVVAESRELAQDAAELIAVEYRELPAVTVLERALAPGAAQLHAELPGNLSFDWVAGDEAATDAAFRAADRVVKLALDNPRMVGNPMEPRACAGTYDAATQKYALYACTQGTAGMRGQLVYAMGVPDDKIDVIAEDVGGGFGVRFNMYPEYCAVLLAARKTARPVKWTGSRSEVFLSDEQGRDVVSTSELALDASGKFLAMRFSYVADLGAYLAPTGPFVNTQGVVACLTGVYEVPAAWARVKLAVTNKAPGAAYRGAGRPVMSYMIERLVDHAAVELGIDPAELRRRNLVSRDKFPYKAANGNTYDCGDFEGVLGDAENASGWAGFPARRAQSPARGRLRGRGMAAYIEASGGGLAASGPGELRLTAGGRGTLVRGGHRVPRRLLLDQGHRPRRCAARARSQVRRHSECARRENRGQVRRDLPERLPRRGSRDRARNGNRRNRALHRGGRRRQHRQSSDRGRTDAGRDHSRGGAGIRRACGVRSRHRAAPHRELHGLPDAARRSGERPRDPRASGADRNEPAPRKGRGPSRRERLAPPAHECRIGCASAGGP